VNLWTFVSIGKTLRWQLRKEAVRDDFTINLVMHHFKPSRIPSIGRQDGFQKNRFIKKPLRAKRLDPNSKLPRIKRISDKMEAESSLSETISNKENETENKANRCYIKDRIKR
jgi:hypothetical protein